MVKLTRECAAIVGFLVVALALVAGLQCARAEDVAVVEQVWASSGIKYDETDSLAACRVASGDVFVFATAKDGNRIDVFDVANGKFLRSYGAHGGGPGQFSYPNGIVAVEFGQQSGGTGGADARQGVVILVIERDGHRVQGFCPDDWSFAGTFGAEVLKRPYGGAVYYGRDGVYLYVTDTGVPREETVRVFRLKLGADKVVRAELVRSFGEREGAGVVSDAESIVVDGRSERVLLCDEDGQQHNVKVYTLEGKFTGQVFGGAEIEREPEGIAVVDTPGGGYVILTDQQKKLSVWHLYDRNTYRHLGAFTGRPRVANTDGICVYGGALARFPAGALFAVHDDAEVRAYSLEEISRVAERGRAGGD